MLEGCSLNDALHRDKTMHIIGWTQKKEPPRMGALLVVS